MFDFHLRGTTSESTPNDNSPGNLTPLPDKLSLRSNHHSPPSTNNHDEGDEIPHETGPSLFRRPNESFEGSAELGGTTFAELLGKGDARESVLIHGGGAEVRDIEGGQGEETLRGGENILVLPGGGWGVIGPDAHLLLQELHRSRISVAQARRRRISSGAGLVSLLVFGLSFWLLVATIACIIRFGGGGRGKLRWITFSVYLSSLLVSLLVISFLRTRRPSTLGMIALISTTFIALLHTLLAIVNFILTFLYRDALSMSGVSWAVDIAWIDLDPSAGRGRGRENLKGWIIVAVVRFFVVVIVSLAWLWAVRSYNRSIHTPFVISPHALPSSELRTLLDRHRATIIPLSTPIDSPATSDNPDRLPSHLDRAHYVQASEASAAYSYVSERMRSSSSGIVGEEGGNALSTWVQAKVWRGVGWLFGVQPYDERQVQEDGAREKEDAHGTRSNKEEENLLTTPWESRSFRVVDRPSVDIASSDHYNNGDDSITRSSLFSKRFSTGSSAPLLQTSSSPSPDHGTTEFKPVEETRPPPLPPKDERIEYYVRMSDGRLVRRLSTIASLDLRSDTGEEQLSTARRNRSDLSGDQSYVSARCSDREVLVDNIDDNPAGRGDAR
ncbi:uncharacterized protein JCM6883_000744 [Sporobolomyces salmoneus]|uniref:uncharacterized protein n=1 Tax=Sporobolomyces salmoneus TaxID=183962 RepID=UPI00316B9DC8